MTTAITPDADLIATFGERGTFVIGHTHHRSIGASSDLRVVNAGSVGMPYESDVSAFWTLVEDGEPRSATPFDVEARRRRDRASDWPRGRVRRREPVRRRRARRGDRSSRRSDEGPDRQVGRPHGIDGAFFVEQPSDDERWWRTGATFLADGARVTVVAHRRPPAGRSSSTGRLARGLLEVERDALPPTEDDEYYAFQLVGLTVQEETGRELGSVKLVLPGIANDVLELDSGVLLPMVEDCVRDVDLDAGRIVVARGFADRCSSTSSRSSRTHSPG